MSRPRPRLAVTVHDPGGNFLPGLRRLAGPLTSTFAGIGALVTDDTAEPVARFLADALGARVDRAPSDVGDHVYELMTGRRWDLMFAIRCLSPAAARVVVEKGAEDTIANDVEWPLVVEAAGLDLAWFAADGLTYRVCQDFDAPADERDHDPAEWIDRVELAAGHVRVLKAHLDRP